jgi:hypothetical protein
MYVCQTPHTALLLILVHMPYYYIYTLILLIVLTPLILVDMPVSMPFQYLSSYTLSLSPLAGGGGGLHVDGVPRHEFVHNFCDNLEGYIGLHNLLHHLVIDV